MNVNSVGAYFGVAASVDKVAASFDIAGEGVYNATKFILEKFSSSSPEGRCAGAVGIVFASLAYECMSRYFAPVIVVIPPVCAAPPTVNSKTKFLYAAAANVVMAIGMFALVDKLQ